MLSYRGLLLSRLSNGVAKNLLAASKSQKPNSQQIRNAHEAKLYYRDEGKGPSKPSLLCEILGAVVWWNFLYHMFTDYHELIPHKYRDPSTYTDEELGIPPEDE